MKKGQKGEEKMTNSSQSRQALSILLHMDIQAHPHPNQTTYIYIPEIAVGYLANES